jgi:hypothetical protein
VLPRVQTAWSSSRSRKTASAGEPPNGATSHRQVPVDVAAGEVREDRLERR